MSIIEILLDIVFHLVGAAFKLIFGIIGAIIQDFWLPILIGVTLYAIYFLIKYKDILFPDTPAPDEHIIDFSDNVFVSYKDKPPNFRAAYSDELGMIYSCGSCTYCVNIASKQPVCKKYGVKYRGMGCLDKTVCNDYNNVLF